MTGLLRINKLRNQNQHQISIVMTGTITIFKNIKETTPETHIFIISGYRITQIIEESTGIEHTAILNEHTNHEEITDYISNINSTPLTLAIAETNHYISKLARQFKEAHKKPLITNEQQLSNYNLNDYDILILNTSKPLIYALINFIELKNQGYNIPTILISDKSIDNHSKNKLNSFQLTGCIFKPFQLEHILDIVDSIKNNTPSPDSNTNALLM